MHQCINQSIEGRDQTTERTLPSSTAPNSHEPSPIQDSRSEMRVGSVINQNTCMCGCTRETSLQAARPPSMIRQRSLSQVRGVIREIRRSHKESAVWSASRNRGYHSDLDGKHANSRNRGYHSDLELKHADSDDESSHLSRTSDCVSFSEATSPLVPARSLDPLLPPVIALARRSTPHSSQKTSHKSSSQADEKTLTKAFSEKDVLRLGLVQTRCRLIPTPRFGSKSLFALLAMQSLHQASITPRNTPKKQCGPSDFGETAMSSTSVKSVDLAEEEQQLRRRTNSPVCRKLSITLSVPKDVKYPFLNNLSKCSFGTYEMVSSGSFAVPQTSSVGMVPEGGTPWKSKAWDCLFLALLTILTVASYQAASHLPADSQGTSVREVWWFAWITALSTGIGTLPLALVPSLGEWAVGKCNAAAGGMMLCASCILSYEAWDLPVSSLGSPHFRVVLGIVLGIIFMACTKAFVEANEDLKFNGLEGLNAKKALLVMGVMTVHSFSEGVGLGVSFAQSAPAHLGKFISISLALHNIPEGLAVSIALVPRGLPVRRAFAWSIFTSLPQPLMAVPAFFFVEHFTDLLPVGLGFAAGAMGFLSILELLPEAIDAIGHRDAIVTSILSFLVMLAFQLTFY
eukprot:gb/GEZN01003833.1/.p1 GENE.gb/GEZN01003833.1/~~gb/GEZN01003833.1/.p1  ORF type:complete len:628 (-),score=28.04 gb/GEZN01003833.1/:9-1892(-)